MLGYQLMQRPSVAAAVQEKLRDALFNDLIPASIEHLSRVLHDPKAADRDKNQASKIVFQESRHHLGDATDKDPSEMTLEELAARRKQLELMQAAIDQTASDRAKQVDSTPVTPDAFE